MSLVLVHSLSQVVEGKVVDNTGTHFIAMANFSILYPSYALCYVVAGDAWKVLPPQVRILRVVNVSSPGSHIALPPQKFGHSMQMQGRDRQNRRKCFNVRN